MVERKYVLIRLNPNALLSLPAFVAGLTSTSFNNAQTSDNSPRCAGESDFKYLIMSGIEGFSWLDSIAVDRS